MICNLWNVLTQFKALSALLPHLKLRHGSPSAPVCIYDGFAVREHYIDWLSSQWALGQLGPLGRGHGTLQTKTIWVLSINVTLLLHVIHMIKDTVTSPTIITRCFGVRLVPVLQLGYIDSETRLYAPGEHCRRPRWAHVWTHFRMNRKCSIRETAHLPLIALKRRMPSAGPQIWMKSSLLIFSRSEPETITKLFI